jgi:predicted DNA-binding protein (MmcQ/YjbR family)
VTTDVAVRVRAICLGFPETTEKVTHGAPGFFVRKQFAMLWPSGHHDNHFPHVWCAAEPGAQEALVASSERFFRPPYVGHRGWIGIRLDGDVDWDEIRDLLEDAYRCIAPPRLTALLANRDEPSTG